MVSPPPFRVMGRLPWLLLPRGMVIAPFSVLTCRLQREDASRQTLQPTYCQRAPDGSSLFSIVQLALTHLTAELPRAFLRNACSEVGHAVSTVTPVTRRNGLLDLSGRVIDVTSTSRSLCHLFSVERASFFEAHVGPGIVLPAATSVT